ncbi:hypothetical protein Cpir12675_004775 [Ceratocystis pirilliformis]|uniref:Uncharacterized protein n=1 Tax=Ceratocystis pirilliformis TaxID=259994 RepID=A0ABR3YUB3_9PEZI
MSVQAMSAGPPPHIKLHHESNIPRAVTFNNPFQAEHAYLQQPRTFEDPNSIQLVSSAPDIPSGRISDVEYPFWVKNCTKAVPYDSKAYAGAHRSYSLANIRPESCHRRNSSITILPPPVVPSRTSTSSDTRSKKSDLERIRDASPPPTR